MNFAFIGISYINNRSIYYINHQFYWSFCDYDINYYLADLRTILWTPLHFTLRQYQNKKFHNLKVYFRIIIIILYSIVR